MEIDVLWIPAELDAVDLAGRAVAVVDVVRASTTILAALEAGAERVIPVASAEEAASTVDTLGAGRTLLCGERGGERIEGFDLGNSPREFHSEGVAGRTVVLSTTNGTRALRRVGAADTVMVACLRNVGAVAARLAGQEAPLVVCAGRGGRVGLDDVLCAGRLVEGVLARFEAGSSPGLGDGARAARWLARDAGTIDAETLRRTAAGAALTRIGLDADLDDCAERDASRAVPVLEEGEVRLASGRSRAGIRDDANADDEAGGGDPYEP